MSRPLVVNTSSKKLLVSWDKKKADCLLRPFKQEEISILSTSLTILRVTIVREEIDSGG